MNKEQGHLTIDKWSFPSMRHTKKSLGKLFLISHLTIVWLFFSLFIKLRGGWITGGVQKSLNLSLYATQLYMKPYAEYPLDSS